MNIVDFKNPSSVDVEGKIRVQEQLARLKESDAMLLRARDGVAAEQASMEAVYAQAQEIPVVVWHDRQDLSDWLKYHSNGEESRAKDALQSLINQL